MPKKPEESAAQFYARMNEARTVDIEEFIEFLMTHDGDPSPTFANSLRVNPEKYSEYVRSMQALLCDEYYVKDFFSVTGKVLRVPPNKANLWAEKIAQSIVDQTSTLQ